jgi:hypothetical protein
VPIKYKDSGKKKINKPSSLSILTSSFEILPSILMPPFKIINNPKLIPLYQIILHQIMISGKLIMIISKFYISKYHHQIINTNYLKIRETFRKITSNNYNALPKYHHPRKIYFHLK